MHRARLLRQYADYEAIERIGRYDGPQVGDPILTDLGLASSVRSVLQYAVWGLFPGGCAGAWATVYSPRKPRAVGAR